MKTIAATLILFASFATACVAEGPEDEVVEEVDNAEQAHTESCSAECRDQCEMVENTCASSNANYCTCAPRWGGRGCEVNWYSWTDDSWHSDGCNGEFSPPAR